MNLKLKFYSYLEDSNWVLILFWISVYCLIIFQDYIFSELRHTGFYWSEVILFNGYWLLFIPLSLIEKRLVYNVGFHKLPFFKKIIWRIFFGFVLSTIHLLIFTSVVTLVSELCFSPPHLFMNTLISSVSKDLYLTVLVYFFVPYVLSIPKQEKLKNSENKVNQFAKKLIVKKDKRQISIDVTTIYFFNSNKPYTELHTKERKYLLNQSLKNVEDALDPSIFLRVHRSTIINRNYIKEFASRKNGDYDVVLENKKVLRLSRHYRRNWEQLIK